MSEDLKSIGRQVEALLPLFKNLGNILGLCLDGQQTGRFKGLCREAQYIMLEQLGPSDYYSDISKILSYISDSPSHNDVTEVTEIIRSASNTIERKKNNVQLSEASMPQGGSIITSPQFSSRKTVIAAADMLMALGHSGLDRFLLELGLPDPDVGKVSGGLMGRVNSIAKYAIEHPSTKTAEGQPLVAAIVAEAGRIYRQGIVVNISEKHREAFQRASSGDGPISDVTIEAPPFQPTLGDPKGVEISGSFSATRKPNRRIFIVHGHDAEMKEAVARYVQSLGLEATILSEQPNGGKTVIEKFEKHADVGYAIILLSPDDHSATNAGRGRQNVILEWGYFIGRLGRSHVCALKRGDVELPSDIIGIVWEPYDDNGGWRGRLLKELIAANVEVDRDKALKA